MKILKKTFPFLLITLFVIFTYWDLPKTFFQQDEWQQFGSLNYFSSLPKSSILLAILPPTQALSHFNPLTVLFFRLEYFLFGINFPPYAIVNVIFHLMNTILVFYFACRLLERKDLALVSGLLFAVNSLSHQAVSWVAASTGLAQSTFFLLLSLIFFLKRSFWLSFLLLFFSLLFKETSIFLFLFFSLSWLVWIKEKDFSKGKSVFTPLFIFALIYLLLRLFFLFVPSSPQPEVTNITPPPFSVYFYRLVSVPARVLSQSVFPAEFIIQWAEKLIFLAYPQFIALDRVPDPYITQSIVTDLISYYLTAVILIINFLIIRYLDKTREKKLSKALIFSLAFIAIGSLPFMFIPGPAGYFSIFEPRNLYIVSIGASLMLVIFSYSLATFLSKRKKTINLLTIIFLIPLLIFHIKITRDDLKSLKTISNLRKSFLLKIKTAYSDLPEKVIFYTQSDKPYYGMPEEEKILPVQSGFGRMLMVWYQKNEQFPGCLYENQFLHDLRSQGYQECEGRGFGYFREYDKLVESVRDNQVPVENVITYSWDGEKEKFTDITQLVREQLKKEKL